MYASVADLRAEGVTLAMATDERLEALIEEAQSTIDRLTGWFFAPREMALRVDGRGAPTLEPPYPPIRVMRLVIDGAQVRVRPNTLFVEGAPSRGQIFPRLTLLDGRFFPRGAGNVLVEGLWGFTEEDGTPDGRTPLAVRRATMLLVIRALPLLADDDAAVDLRNRWRITEEKTRDQTIRFAASRMREPETGDTELDRLLLPYRRPAGLGAA